MDPRLGWPEWDSELDFEMNKNWTKMDPNTKPRQTQAEKIVFTFVCLGPNVLDFCNFFSLGHFFALQMAIFVSSHSILDHIPL